MFVPDYSESIPGYTGHRQEQLNVEPDTQQPGGPRKHIPGYGGYVPGVKSENVFGQTYGKTSFASSAGSFPKGIDQDPHVKFNSVMKGEFIDHSQVAHLHETTAQIVGVSRGQDMYKKVSKKCLKFYDTICCNLSFTLHTVTNINDIYFCFYSQFHLVKFTLSMDLPLHKKQWKNNLKVQVLKINIMPLLELSKNRLPV